MFFVIYVTNVGAEAVDQLVKMNSTIMMNDALLYIYNLVVKQTYN